MSEPPKKKNKVGRPVGRAPKYKIHNSVDPLIGEAIEAFRASQRFPPLIKDILEASLMDFLEKEGFWPPSKPKGDS